MTWAQWAVTLIGSIGGMAGAAALLNAFFTRGKTRAEAAQIVTGTAVTMMKELEEDAAGARTELKAVRVEARALAEELYRIRMAIMRSDATIEGLRQLISAGPASNGASAAA